MEVMTHKELRLWVILWMDKIQESSLLYSRPGVGVGTISQWEGSAELFLCLSVPSYCSWYPGFAICQEETEPWEGTGGKGSGRAICQEKEPSKDIADRWREIRKARQHRSKKNSVWWRRNRELLV